MGKIVAALALVVGIGAGSYYFLVMDPTKTDNTAVTTVETKENKEESKSTETSEPKKEETEKNDAASAEKEKQAKLVNGDIDKIKAALKENNITESTTGDFSKDSKVTISASSGKLSKIGYVGENKSGTLSRVFSIGIKHPAAEEFDIEKYAPAKALIEKVIEAPFNAFEFSDGLTERMTTTKDSKMSYDFIVGDNYKISVDINKNAAETVTIKVELK